MTQIQTTYTVIEKITSAQWVFDKVPGTAIDGPSEREMTTLEASIFAQIDERNPDTLTVRKETGSCIYIIDRLTLQHRDNLIEMFSNCLGIAHQIDPSDIIAVPEDDSKSEIMPRDFIHLAYDKATDCHYYAPQAGSNVHQDLTIKVLLVKDGHKFCVEQGLFETSGYRIKRVKKHFGPMLKAGWKIAVQKTAINHVYHEERILN